MKKLKIISILMAVAIAAAAVAGCGDSKPASTSKESSATSAVSAASAASTGEASATSESESSTEASSTSKASSASEASSASKASSASAASASEASSASAAAGELVPSITIEYGDVDAIVALGKDAQNFAITEGTVVAISGIYSKPISTMNISERGEDGKLKGVNMYVDGDWEAPADETDIDIIGTFVKGQNFMELHVLPETKVFRIRASYGIGDRIPTYSTYDWEKGSHLPERLDHQGRGLQHFR